MKKALRIAKIAEGQTSPDPLVGAILVKKGKIIASGYHGQVTTPHAETWAIQKAQKKARGATLYLNLEPCGHFGNNPPCTEAIIQAGITEVIAAMKDPNPLVKGKGFKTLRKAGVKVKIGLLEKEAKELNEVFLKYITTKTPFVVLKLAMTLDGKIATRTGASRWVASFSSRRFAHHLRNLYDAILVGVNTVLIDNPQLTVRLVKKKKNPLRIVLDAFARTPLSARVLKTQEAHTLIIVSPLAAKKKIQKLREKGAEILVVKSKKRGEIDCQKLLKKLGERQISSLLIEGGGEVAASFLEAKAVDKILFFIAPKIFGGRTAKTPVEGKGVTYPSQAWKLEKVAYQKIGSDLLIQGELKN